MKVLQEEFSLRTSRRNEMINIDRPVRDIVGRSNLEDGDLVVFCPHTTAAITINENGDPDSVHDILMTFSEVFPKDRPGYRHGEGNSDSHCKSSLVGASEQVLIKDGQLLLGTWQSLYLCEFDGPRTRRVLVQVRGL